MTYDEILALIAQNNLYTTNAYSTPTGEQRGGETAYLADPNNPLAGYAMVGPDGSLEFTRPRDPNTGQGGQDFWSYGADGSPINSGFRDSTRDWQDSLFGAVGTLGGAALGANAIGGMMNQGPLAGLFGGSGAVPPVTGGELNPYVGLPTGGAGAGSGAMGVSGAYDFMNPGPEMYAGGTPGFYDGSAVGGAWPGDVPPGIVDPSTGGINWGGLSGAAAAAGGIGNFLAQNPTLARLLPGLIGAGVGAAGSGPMTTSTTETQSISDPAYQQFRDDAFNALRTAANQPYQAPGFSLTQGPQQGQLDAMGVFGDFANGGRDVTSAANAEMGAVRDMIGRGTTAGTSASNPLADENNPWLTNMISAGAKDMTDAYARLVAPTYAGTSSFGNRNMGEYENADRSNLMQRIGNLSDSMRFQDHNLRAQLLESGAGRSDAMTNANLNRLLQGGSILGSLGESAAGRADSVATGNANRALTGANSLFGAGTTLWGQGQQNIENQYAEFLRGQNWGREGARLMQAGLSAPYGRTATSSTTTPGNRAAGALGGFTVGMQAGGLFNGQPMGGSGPRTVGSLSW